MPGRTPKQAPNGKGGSYIEMLLMTGHGLEILSRLDRRLIVI